MAVLGPWMVYLAACAGALELGIGLFDRVKVGAGGSGGFHQTPDQVVHGRPPCGWKTCPSSPYAVRVRHKHLADIG